MLKNRITKEKTAINIFINAKIKKLQNYFPLQRFNRELFCLKYTGSLKNDNVS